MVLHFRDHNNHDWLEQKEKLMHTKESIQSGLYELQLKYGNWSNDIPLPFGLWTRGNLHIPHTRLKRILQIANDLSIKPLSESRVLDLGCLDGIFSIEFAQHGAHTLGVEVRESNIQKAIFCKNAYGLDNLEFLKEDVRNLSVDRHGKFDVIICSGILYHLPAADAIGVMNQMFQMTNRIVIIDTQISFEPEEMVLHNGEEFWGRTYREHADDATPEEKEKNIWGSADNTTSFWFTRPSLINLLSKVGFSSVYECFTPTHNEIPDRCTLVAIKSSPCELHTSPYANGLREDWPENSLTYAPKTKTLEEAAGTIHIVPMHQRIFTKLRKLLGR